MITLTPKIEKRLVIKQSLKIARGHRFLGGRVHNDKRTRRCRTRNAQKHFALSDY